MVDIVFCDDRTNGTKLSEFEEPRPIFVDPPRFNDERGFFSETWNRKRFEELGINVDFVQDNHSHSRDPGVVRGLHFQAPPHAQGKLVRVISGSVLDVAVDIRKGSSSYGLWSSILLSAKNGLQFYVPPGFLHGFATLEPETGFLYKCTDYYMPASEGTVRFDDPDLAIDWGIDPLRAILSEKDQQAAKFADFDSPFVHEKQGP